MIISHEHRFVFVKTHKTAGTSIEVFLSEIAGEDAVVTPVEPPVAGHRARHYKAPTGVVPRLVWRARRRLRRGATHAAYYNHISASGIKKYLGARRWDGYFTFCFERNPWEKVVSWYYFALGRGEFDGSFREFVMDDANLISDFDLYSLDGETVGVDFVGRYENLRSDLERVLHRLALYEPFELTREKGNYRPRDATVEALFDDEMSERVERAFAREIRAFDYTRPEHLAAPAESDVLRRDLSG